MTRLPAWLHEPFAAAMSQSLLLPAFFALFGVVAAMFLLGFGDSDRLVEEDDLEDADRNAGYAVEYGGDETFVDDDEYLEYTVSWDEPEPVTQAEPVVQADDWGYSPRKLGPHPPEGQGDVTEPMRSRADHLLHAPAKPWHWGHRPPKGRGMTPSSRGTLCSRTSARSRHPSPRAEPRTEPPRESWRRHSRRAAQRPSPAKPQGRTDRLRAQRFSRR